MATTAAATTARMQDGNENFNIKTCLNDLTKIPQKEFEAQFRNWMEKDGVARAMQAKLRADLIANFNKTNLGKHIIGQTPTNRLTLSPMEMALNTLVAEFLFAQNCHFTLSVYSTEAPFRNTLPDFDSITHFRFKENEVTEIVKAICGPLNYDWNIKNRVLKNYAANKSTALLFLILKALLDNNAEKAQHKVSVGTNTRQFKTSTLNQPLTSSDLPSPQQTRRESKAEFYNSNFRYLNRYLIILSRKVKDMSEQFERLQFQSGTAQPRVRVFKSFGRRKYEDLNRSLERVTENLKQMANAKRKSKRISTIVKAIEALATQFQKCAENFEHVSKDLKTSARSKADKSTTSCDLKNPTVKNNSSTTTAVAASQTDLCIEKSFGDWLHEMRYTRNGQKFLDRIERSFLKAMEKQKRELLAENEVKLRHQRELMRIRYKQKVIQEICSHGSQSTHRNETQASNLQTNETISEQFRQFELKHFDLLSKIYESEAENRASDSRTLKETPQRTVTTEKVVHFNVKENEPLPKSSSDLETSDLKFTSSSENMEQIQQSRQVLKEQNANDLREQVKAAIADIVVEERNVDQIVFDAKLRIRELEQESNQLTENFLGYLDRQREQKLAAREAAQSLWNDYMSEREKMQERYNTTSLESKLLLRNNQIINSSQSRELGDIKCKQGDLRETLELFLKEHKNRNEPPKTDMKDKETLMQHNALNGVRGKDSGSESSSSYMELKNPIIQAKESFFERERQFKAETTKHLIEDGGISSIDFNDFLRLDKCSSGYPLKTMTTTTTGPFELIYMQSIGTERPKKTSNLMSTVVSDSLSGTNTDLSTHAGELGNIEMAATSNVQLAANWLGSLERPQNVNVNKSRRREIIATAKEALQNTKRITTITANAILAATTTAITPTTAPIIPRALNKNNAGGASVAEAQLEHSNNSKIKSDADYGRKHTLATQQQQQQQEQKEWYNNKNNSNNKKTSNIKSNNSTEVRAIATEASMTVSSVQTSKPSLQKPKVGGNSGAELSRRAVLKQTMARMQQLFSPHQQYQPQQEQKQKQELQYQKQQIMLAHLTEEEENDFESEHEEQIAMGKVEKLWPKEKKVLESITHSNNNNNNNNKNIDTTNTHSQNVVDADSENVVGYYKNNFLSKQNAIKRTAKDQQDQQQITQIPTTSTRNIHQQKVATAAANKTTSTTLHSIDDGNKTAEALADWQQIACSPSGRQNEAKVNVDKVKAAKVTNAVAKGSGDNDLLDEYDDDDFEKDIKEDTMNLPHEPGEIFERNQTSTETVNQVEIGELIELSASDDVQLRTPLVSGASLSTSEVSSIDLQLSVGGGIDVGGGNSDDIRVSSSQFNMAASGAINVGNGSDSGSDFWA